MLDHDLVGQHFIVDFDGPEVTPRVERLIRDGRISGVILFAKNIRSPEQARRLTEDLQALAREAGLPPLFITIDQEGGLVNRISDGISVFPGAMAIGATASEQDAAAAGRITALELRTLGINVNHAPVLDVNTNPRNPIIGSRAFGEDPKEVARLGVAYIRAAQDAGILTTVKHFPGHGATAVDSHLDLPVVEKSREELDREEFFPFSRAFEAGAAGCMAAHIVFPVLNRERPATFAPDILSSLLRRELRFNGVVFSDSMAMKAVADRWPRGEAAVEAIAAGVDLVLACGTEEEQWESLHAVGSAMSAGRVIRKSTNEWINLARERFVTSPPQGQVLGSAEHRRIAQDIADRAITLVRTARRALPLTGSKTAVVHAGRSVWVDQTRRFVRLLRDSGNAAELVEEPDGSKWDRVVVASHSWQSDAAAEIVPTLHDRFGERLLVVGFGAPYELANFPQVQTYLVAYGPDLPSMTAAAKVLTGALQPSGRLPVTIPGLYPRGHRADL